MKVTLVFGLLAIYGAVAAPADSTEVTTGTTVNTESSWSIGSSLQAINDMAQTGIAQKQNAVAMGVDVMNSSVIAGTDFGAAAITNATSLAENAIDMGTNMALEGMNVAGTITNKTMDALDAMPVIGKFIPTNIMKNVVNKGLSVGGKVATHAGSAGKKGVNFGGSIGSSVLGAIGSGTSRLNGAIVAGDQMANAIASNTVASSVQGISSFIKGFGSRLSKVGSSISTNAELPSVSASASVTA